MKLWRGDSDSNNARMLRMSLPRIEGLLSNMASGGNPLALSQQSFLASIHQHVVPGWVHTHFLSFSKSMSVARRFAAGNSGKLLQTSTQNRWDTIVVEMDLSKMTHVKNVGVGMDHFQFQELGLNQNLIQAPPMVQIARTVMFQNKSPCIRNILLIDVHQHLSHLHAHGATVAPLALTYSQNDQEVLILPVDPLPGIIGNTAILDFGCISQIEYFELV